MAVYVCRKMVMETSDKVVRALGTADIDARLEELLIDGILYAYQEQARASWSGCPFECVCFHAQVELCDISFRQCLPAAVCMSWLPAAPRHGCTTSRPETTRP